VTFNYPEAPVPILPNVQIDNVPTCKSDIDIRGSCHISLECPSVVEPPYSSRFGGGLPVIRSARQGIHQWR